MFVYIVKVEQHQGDERISGGFILYRPADAIIAPAAYIQDNEGVKHKCFLASAEWGQHKNSLSSAMWGFKLHYKLGDRYEGNQHPKELDEAGGGR
jgi:hypothetical protein